ncbi:aldehyde dehydrogenase family protein [Oceaniradius stylonematis]|uniref:aldehyde dehydrogenase family protein n=1 Tax=Oceaniradius stylonematis TaxID=2184161 RepID=UPI00273D2F3A|nr:aldehyde dehydrogenase family protein [Oceaniradius stylonematis]
MDVTDPESGVLVGTVARQTEVDARAALDRASAARAEVARLPTQARMAALLAGVDALKAAAETVANLIASEGIKTISEARSEVQRAAETLRLSAEAARSLTGETIRFDQYPTGVGRTGWAEPMPVGVVLGITPFNDPLNLVAHKVGPAVAAGCPIILKPHEATPLSALWLVEALAEHLPKGALEVLTGYGAELVPPLLADDRVRLVSFTGGLATGRKIAAAAGLTRLVMELGSNCATIVMDDADLDPAADACLSGAIAAAGQNCLHVQRIIAQRGIYPKLRARLADGFRGVVTGSKKDPQTQMGCMIDEKAAMRVEAMGRNATNTGATMLAGGARDGVHCKPTLLENVQGNDPILCDEVFGPITALMMADDINDAIAQANATPFGLQAAIFTRRLDHAHRAVKALDVGTVIVNDSTDYRLDAMPFGGTGLSGLGREGVASAVASMTEPKLASFRWPTSF